jgi:hypothetical protein
MAIDILCRKDIKRTLQLSPKVVKGVVKQAIQELPTALQ